MLVRAHHDPRDFLELVEPFLLQREVENALPLGIARSFVELATHDGLMFSVESAAGVVAVALKSPKRNLVMTTAPECALRALATYLNTYAFPVPGVNAPIDTAREFGRTWTELSGTTMTERVRLRIFELRALADSVPPPPAGEMRFAALEDAELVERWLRAFIDEATNDPHDSVRERVARLVGASNVALWTDAAGQPVSMSAVVRRSPRGATLAWVYTPPEHRMKGFATACVAELSRRELAAGRAFCTLYADQQNPTANQVYERIGYVPVCEALDAPFH